MTFKQQFDKSIKATNVAIEKAIRGAAIEMFSEIVKRTPVGNPSLWKDRAPAGYIGGRLRGNWQASISRPNYDELTDVDASGGSTIGKGVQQINGFRMRDNDIYFTNNLPYAERIENGWSQQRPQGMVKVTVASFKPIMEKIARKYKV